MFMGWLETWINQAVMSYIVQGLSWDHCINRALMSYSIHGLTWDHCINQAVISYSIHGLTWDHCINRATVVMGWLETTVSVIFLPARPASQTHDSHKGRMIFNHESPAGRIKNCGEKSALSFWMFFLLAHRVLNNIGKNRYRNTPQQ